MSTSIPMPSGRNLSSLLQPESIAVVGASRNPGKVGHEILQNLIAGGFSGTLIPVNPSTESILDRRCYPSLSAWKNSVDLVVIAVPKMRVQVAVEEAIQAGARAVVLITAGYRETGAEGAAEEDILRDLCQKNKVRLLGPNCLGLINASHKMNASFAAKMPVQGNISVLSQSGALCTAILDWAASRRLGLSKLISIGNKADISEIDLLSNLSRDPETGVIMGYLESVTSGDQFIKAAEAASNIKPVVIFKSGTTNAGQRAASSHTGSLAGGDTGFMAAFSQAGVIRAPTFEAMFDFATAFSMQPLPQGDRVAIITNAGGPGIMAADAVEKAGMQVGRLEGGIQAALRQKLPAAASVGNPIDVLGDADPERYLAAFQAAEQDPEIDAIVIILTPQAMTEPAETARVLAQANQGKKTVLVSFMGGEDVMPGRDELVQAGLPDYPSPERAVLALQAMWYYTRWRNRPPRVVTRFPVNRRRVERIVNRHSRNGQAQVSEEYAKKMLQAYDFNVPAGMAVKTAAEAVAVSEQIGFPLVMKVQSPDIIHKSDCGGVKLNLHSPSAVRDAFDLMLLRIREQHPEARLDGVYLERMCPAGREVILGMQRDPQFGPLLMFGLGGIFVEVMKDVTFHIAPVTREEALQMLSQTKSFQLLKGVRGNAAVDLEAIAEALQRISQLVTDFPMIQEMDINPFIVGEPGQAAYAADARITLNLGESSDA